MHHQLLGATYAFNMHLCSWDISAGDGDMVLARVGTGTMFDLRWFVSNTGNLLKRPCGLCFDDAGDLYVASLTDEVMSASWTFSQTGSCSSSRIKMFQK